MKLIKYDGIVIRFYFSHSDDICINYYISSYQEVFHFIFINHNGLELVLLFLIELSGACISQWRKDS